MSTTNPPRIAIGSTNPVKVQAAHTVLESLYAGAEFVPVEVASGIRAQPWGDPETRTGAINRARAACAQAGADFGVGFEGGVVETEIGLMLCNWAAFYAADGRIGVGCGGGMLLPPQVANSLYAQVELGPAMDALTGGHDTRRGDGAVGILTAGLVNRQAAFEYTLKLALAPFRTAHYYQADQLPERLRTQRSNLLPDQPYDQQTELPRTDAGTHEAISGPSSDSGGRPL